jgi:hypothetical protein
MPKQAVLEAFKRLIEPELKARGFVGRRGHFVRKNDPHVAQVIELQHSIYGGRLTANLGIDLDFLRPIVRWIACPTIGPHAHDATRWIRIGLVRPDRTDCWWSFDVDSEDGIDEAARSAGRAIVDHGIPWLEAECAPESFVHYAEARLERSKTSDRPEGSFLELRLMSAVLAWNGDLDGAARFGALARLCWPEERSRLQRARHEFRKKNTQLGKSVADVPDIQAELEAFISTTMASRRSISRLMTSKPKRSKSGRLRSSPA